MELVITLAALTAATGFGAIAWRVVRDERARSQARVAALATVLDGTPAGPGAVTGVQALFDADRRPKAAGGPLIKVAAGFGMVVLVIIAVALTGDRRSAETAAPVDTERQDAALELLSMRHERDGDTLLITGLVRNHATIPAERISAVILTFDRDGRFLASGHAPLDFGVLAPGDESPFRVAIPRVTDVGRYRVSFRTETGVVRHADRRSAQASAN